MTSPGCITSLCMLQRSNGDKSICTWSLPAAVNRELDSVLTLHTFQMQILPHVVSPAAANSWPLSSLVTSSSPAQPSRSSTCRGSTRVSPVTHSPVESSCFSHLLDEFAAQRDVGAAEDVGHVPGHAEVVLFIWLWHLHMRRQEWVSSRGASGGVWDKTRHPGRHRPGWASCWWLWNGSSLPRRRRRRSVFLDWGANITRDGWRGLRSSGDIVLCVGLRQTQSGASSLTCSLVVDQFAHFALNGGERFPRLLLHQ